MAGHVYHWKHGWIPLDHAAADLKAHGDKTEAHKLLVNAEVAKVAAGEKDVKHAQRTIDHAHGYAGKSVSELSDNQLKHEQLRAKDMHRFATGEEDKRTALAHHKEVQAELASRGHKTGRSVPSTRERAKETPKIDVNRPVGPRSATGASISRPNERPPVFGERGMPSNPRAAAKEAARQSARERQAAFMQSSEPDTSLRELAKNFRPGDRVTGTDAHGNTVTGRLEHPSTATRLKKARPFPGQKPFDTAGPRYDNSWTIRADDGSLPAVDPHSVKKVEAPSHAKAAEQTSRVKLLKSGEQKVANKNIREGDIIAEYARHRDGTPADRFRVLKVHEGRHGTLRDVKLTTRNVRTGEVNDNHLLANNGSVHFHGSGDLAEAGSKRHVEAGQPEARRAAREAQTKADVQARIDSQKRLDTRRPEHVRAAEQFAGAKAEADRRRAAQTEGHNPFKTVSANDNAKSMSDADLRAERLTLNKKGLLSDQEEARLSALDAEIRNRDAAKLSADVQKNFPAAVKKTAPGKKVAGAPSGHTLTENEHGSLTLKDSAGNELGFVETSRGEVNTKATRRNVSGRKTVTSYTATVNAKTAKASGLTPGQTFEGRTRKEAATALAEAVRKGKAVGR